MTIPDHSAPAASDNKPGGVQPSSAGAGGGVGGGGGTSRVQNNTANLGRGNIFWHNHFGILLLGNHE